MFKGLKPTYRKTSEVLNNISQEQIFFEYLGIYPDLGKRYLSPFRQDKDPGCRFTWHSGILYFVENTMFNNKLYWSCIDVVMYMKSCSYQEALDLLWTKSSSLNIISKSSTVTQKFSPEIRFEKQNWPDDNLYMLPGYILEREYVFLVKNYWIKTKSGWNQNSIHHPAQTICVAYLFPETDHVKLYFPEKQDFRWYSNCTTEDIFGYHKIKHYAQISDELIITKSGKDRLVLDYYLGKSSIALQNEGCFIPDHIVFELETMFKKIWFLYDNDISGIIHAQKLSEKYKFEYKVIDVDQKDPYAMIKEFGLENTQKLIL